eukprot:UN14414
MQPFLSAQIFERYVRKPKSFQFGSWSDILDRPRKDTITDLVVLKNSQSVAFKTVRRL